MVDRVAVATSKAEAMAVGARQSTVRRTRGTHIVLPGIAGERALLLTARRDGTFTGLDVHILANMGAYLRLITPGIPLLGAFMFNGSYKFDAYRFVCDGVFTTIVHQGKGNRTNWETMLGA